MGEVINPVNDDVVAVVHEATGGVGVDAAIRRWRDDEARRRTVERRPDLLTGLEQRDATASPDEKRLP